MLDQTNASLSLSLSSDLTSVLCQFLPAAKIAGVDLVRLQATVARAAPLQEMY